MVVFVLENFFEKGDFDYGIEWISFLICFLVFLVICFVGFVGNIMFIRIFVGKIQCMILCCIYLVMKVVFDNGFLLIFFIVWLDFVNI